MTKNIPDDYYLNWDEVIATDLRRRSFVVDQAEKLEANLKSTKVE